MKVLVDTSVWSLALRRPKSLSLSASHQATVNALTELVIDGRAVLMGAIRQELLSGISTQNQFEALRTHLAVFDDVALTAQDYEMAAQSFNTCRAHGVQGSNTDFLICAVSMRQQLPVFSTDLDFHGYKKWLPIQLYTL